MIRSPCGASLVKEPVLFPAVKRVVGCSGLVVSRVVGANCGFSNRVGSFRGSGRKGQKKKLVQSVIRPLILREIRRAEFVEKSNIYYILGL